MVWCCRASRWRRSGRLDCPDKVLRIAAGRTQMGKGTRFLQPPTASVLLVAAGVLALAIFVFDTVTPFGMAVAVLYVLVVLIAGAFMQGRGILLTSAGCAALTVLSYGLSHEAATPIDALVRCVMSLSAI